MRPFAGGTPVTNYYVYVAAGKTVVEADFEQVADTGETLLFVFTDIVPAETYWFRVVARNLIGMGQLSDSVVRIAATVPS